MTQDKIFFFYSSETEPDILDFYGEILSLLKSKNKNVLVVDTYKNPKIAQKFKIDATPTLIVKKGSKINEYFGIIDGMKELLITDLFGKSLFHGLSHRNGRDYSLKFKLKNQNLISLENILKRKLDKLGINNFSIIRLDKNKKTVKIRLKNLTIKSRKNLTSEILPFLSGVFMEIFGKSVFSQEVSSKVKNTHVFIIK